MASKNRVSTTTVSNSPEQLAKGIQFADFVAAVRILENAAPEKARLGRGINLENEPVRLSQKPTLAFKNNSLDELGIGEGVHRYRLYCNFFGMFGNNGPLPLHLTEYAIQRAEHHQDPTFREFVDLFNHRMLSLFYRAMADADPVINMDRNEDNRYSDFVSALCGLLPRAASERDSIADFSKYNFAAWLGSRSRSPQGLANILEASLKMPCVIEEFIGDWLPIPQEGQIKLGSGESNCELGVSAYSGRRAWSSAHKIRICLGPMSWNDYHRFSPGGEYAQTLADVVRSYLGDELDWEAQLTVKEGEACRMGLSGNCRLGFNSWSIGEKYIDSVSVKATMNRQQLLRQHRQTIEQGSGV
ncbi:hypothetical protein AB833_15120 [Chromatiales bacterium (ex Bugula neritina AB1)]|nr:hypothetical protein AB833_15120 [Chromatiales bacterium (ex Bugula neritina AB1)]